MFYMNETSKIKPRIEKYLNGFVVDIGCADCKVIPSAFGIDGRKFDGVDFVTDNLYTLEEQLHGQIPLADVVFSSHCLEHLVNDYSALISWTNILKSGGYLILYLPDGRRYSNEGNKEHFRDYTHKNFMFWFKRSFCGEGETFMGHKYHAFYELVEDGEDAHEEDLYSFYLVARKL